MEEYGSTPREEFNQKWTEESGLKVTAATSIVASLRVAARQKDDDLVKTARREYPAELFGKFFSYTKGGKQIVLETPRSIARRYLRLTSNGKEDIRL